MIIVDDDKTKPESTKPNSPEIYDIIGSNHFTAFLLMLSFLLRTSPFARFRPSPSFFVFFHSRLIRCIRTVARTSEMAVRNFWRGVRV